MLFSLHIGSIALIRELDIDFSQGFTVFTGETGAGKSIIIDSIALLCGARSDKSIIRTGEEFAEVEGVFGMLSQGVLSALEELGVSPDEEGNLFVSRRITVDGRGVSRIGGRTVPVSKLREVMSLLLDIHGQQDTARLADESLHPVLLDMYGENGDIKSEYKSAYKEYVQIKNQLDALEKSDSDAEEKRDFLSYRLTELKRAKLKKGEEEELTAKLNLLVNREKILVNASEAYEVVYGGDRSAVSLLEQGVTALRTLSKYVEQADGLADRLESAVLECKDIADSVSEYADDPEGDPQRAIDDIQSRLSLISSLCRKYRTDEAGLMDLLTSTEKELNAIETAGERKEELKKELKAAKAKAEAAGEKLYVSRKAAAESMEKQIKDILSGLDMPGITFVTEFERTPLAKDGTDVARFLISANKGEEPRPLSKIASGGECARIMLAVKSVLAKAENIPTMIFDEIDTGISGGTSSKVGERLKELAGSDKQVVCVTHSAQIAALAKTHLLISKTVAFGRTETHVKQLNKDGRIKEIARIMGDDRQDEAVLKAAESMIK